uniref:NADH-ubiquinone oxidoreductase chain 2 n=1 Tax=Tubulipora flabellaris TaxID=365325 RepID=F6GPI8_9BILA|nr:NADH dehydrogenase subunit 2 [Tubulipora flabellaris]ACB12459.1 NADH dehydrogenase subunit 2 [Tubulipora flabellaris]
MSPTWLMVWLFLELNLMAVMPLLGLGLVYYFVIQSLAGLIFLFGGMGPSFPLLLISMMIKLAVFPFSFWMLYVIKSSPWLGGAFLSSLSKLLPLWVLNTLPMKSMTAFLLLTILWGSVYGIFQTKVKGVLACSSVGHTGWLSLFVTMSIKSWFIYFLTYFPLVLLLFLFSSKSEFDYWSSMNYYKIPLLTTLLILSGIPPFSGAWLKIVAFMSLNYEISFMFSLLFFMASALNMFFYFKLMIGMLNKNEKMKFHHLLLSFTLMLPQFLI